MKKLFFQIACVFSVLYFFCGVTVAAENYSGKNPPSLDIIQKNVSMHKQGINVIGIHKERDGAYLVITNKSSNSWGGPYQLLKLESNKWVMAQPGNLFSLFVHVSK